MTRTMCGKPISASTDRPTLRRENTPGSRGSHVAKGYSLEQVEGWFRYPASETNVPFDHARPTPQAPQG